MGYHWVICSGWREKAFFVPALLGAVQQGIPLDLDDYIRGSEVGRHALGYNAKAIGICMIGRDGLFKQEQWNSLMTLLRTLMKNHRIPVENVIGHYETESGKAQGKTCPGVDMVAFRKHLRSCLEVKA
jgi:N-acetylmuramoyl-L-alanine amidase